MRRTFSALAAAALAAGLSVAAAGPAAAAPGNRSVHTDGCAGGEHPGLHKGWTKQQGDPSTERRNVGGTCQAPE